MGTTTYSTFLSASAASGIRRRHRPTAGWRLRRGSWPTEHDRRLLVG